MNQDDIRKLQDFIKGELRPLKDLVEIVKRRVDTQEVFADTISHNVKIIKEQQSVMNQKLDAHTEALVTIEATITAYGDMYKINNSNSKKLEKRLEVLEDKADINPPPELTLADLQ